MGSDIMTALRPTLVMLVLFTLLLCGVYPLAVYGIGQTAFPEKANGSLIHSADGHVIGSELIGQPFASNRYFWPRPSAAGKGYDATASSGSNLGPASAVLVERVKADIARQRAAGVAGPLAADLVTASGSGLDPDISPAAAEAQVARVAAARGLPEAEVKALVARAIGHSLFGDPHLNVLRINRQLDGLSAKTAP